MNNSRTRSNSRQGRESSARKLNLEMLEARVLLAGDTYLINFQNDEATNPSGYERDLGQVFGLRTNGLTYGWSTDLTIHATERSLEADQRFDTLIQIEAGADWEFQLANGDYEVTVAVGDPLNNSGIHTIDVEGTSFFNAVVDTSVPMTATQVVSVSDGLLTLGVGAAGNLDTRINFIQIVGVPSGPNASPSTPVVTEPTVDGQEVNPVDVHMEAVGFFDTDGDLHKSSDWEIWTVGPGAEMVWQTLGIEGVERLHTHLGDGIFVNSQAGQTSLTENTDYELRVRFRDDAGSVSGYATRLFQTGAESTTFPMDIQDILSSPTPTWEDFSTNPIDLPTQAGFLSPFDPIIAIDLDPGQSVSPGGEQVGNAIDGTLAKYLNFGEVDSGFIVTPAVGSTTISSFQITTANDAEERDPDAWELYGTNDPITSANNSTGTNENWTLIDSGSVSLPSARNTPGPTVPVTNSTAYTSYRMIFTGVKNAAAANSMQIAEIDFFGSGQAATSGPLLSSSNPIIAIDTDLGESSYPAGDPPQDAIDGTNASYRNLGDSNSGFIVTPTNTPTIAESFQITTSGNSESRDPASWEIYGTNDPITSADNSTGSNETWTLIDSGSLSLPSARNTDGALVTLTNTTSYESYRVIFPTLKGGAFASSMEIGEFQLFGTTAGATQTPASLRVEAANGDLLLELEGQVAAGNLINNPAALTNHGEVRVRILGGSSGVSLPISDLTFTDDEGRERTIFLPGISVDPGQEVQYWVAVDGSTYVAEASQTEPDFSLIARVADLTVPFFPMEPGFVVEEVGTDFRLPVNIAFVPDPGPNPDDPLYYVTELYGSIQVVTRDGTKHEFATGLLDYNPTGPISGSGEQGLTGIAVKRNDSNPEIYELYVGMLWDNGSPPGGASHYPKVERIDSVAGGLSIDTRTVLLNMQPEVQGQSHQISAINIGPDGKLYVNNGDGFNASTALNFSQYRGKVLRMNLDGTAPTDNPFYTGGGGPIDYIYALGLRNPFGGDFRAEDGKLYTVENGPSTDRFAQINAGASYGWNGSDASMTINALYNWAPAHAPVNIEFVQPETFSGSAFPASMQGRAFISESGPTYASGPQALGKRIVSFELDAAGNVIDGPTTLVEYVGFGRSSVVGLAAGPDGLYFTELYEESGASGPTATGARIFRVRYTGGTTGDFDLDGDVDGDDLTRWENGYGSGSFATVSIGDADNDQFVTGLDFLEWQSNYTGATALTAASSPATEPVAEVAAQGYEEEAVAAPRSTVVEVSEPAAATAPSLPETGNLFLSLDLHETVASIAEDFESTIESLSGSVYEIFAAAEDLGASLNDISFEGPLDGNADEIGDALDQIADEISAELDSARDSLYGLLDRAFGIWS